MKVIVCLKEVVDPTLSLDIGLGNSVIFQEGLPLRLNPNDTKALATALELRKSSSGTPVEITLISIGPARVESYLRNGLALGADRAVRIWDEGFSELSAYQKSRLLSAAISLYGGDLVFTGASSLDTGNCLVCPLIAAALGLPSVVEVVALEMEAKINSITLIADIGQGKREKVQCHLPAVVAFKGEGKLPYASLDNLIESQCDEIILLSPADLAISSVELKNDPTRIMGLVCPKPLPRKFLSLDTSLPAFYRIMQLLEGGMSKRQCQVLQGTNEELVEQLFQLLKEEGVIKPATAL